MRAAGGVCHAVDKVCSGANRNAFCAVRPPGHHAGYRGVVEGGDEPHGSKGFCLVNNVAVGAAYARCMWRHKGIHKIAIIDFDVHHGTWMVARFGAQMLVTTLLHAACPFVLLLLLLFSAAWGSADIPSGNGTEDIVRNLLPTTEEHAVATPMFSANVKSDRYRPWLDADDADNVLFVSTHGYGRKDKEAGKPWFYPGTGVTCGCVPPNMADGTADAAAAAAAAAGGGGSFAPLGGAYDESRVAFAAPGEPNVMNVGLRLAGDNAPPGFSRLEWRDAYRRTILPRLEAFAPDLILVSAGFDGHKKDEMNWGYLALLEDDYKWLTTQLVAVANKCCSGRLVSMLEGGYRVQGGPLSSFARSVAAHVSALAEGSRASYDQDGAVWESEHENHLSREAQRRRLLKLEKDKERAAAAHAVALQAMADDDSRSAATTAVAAVVQQEPAAGEEPAAAHLESPAGQAPAKRPRRGGPVDYAALAAKLDEEAS